MTDLIINAESRYVDRKINELQSDSCYNIAAIYCV